jgi:hypothetical protein
VNAGRPSDDRPGFDDDRDAEIHRTGLLPLAGAIQGDQFLDRSAA